MMSRCVIEDRDPQIDERSLRFEVAESKRASSEVQHVRLSTCRQCENFYAPQGVCRVSEPVVARMQCIPAASSCPIGKWGRTSPPPWWHCAIAAVRAAWRFLRARRRRRVASVALQSRRMSVCGECDSFDAKRGRCNQCGCYVALKIKSRVESCPRGKW